MNRIVADAIVLTRTDYGEADRILTLLTPNHGKLRLMAKGVRRVKSKLAGGIELFSVSTITFVRGRGEIGTLISTRLVKHYGRIVQDLDRTMLGYELIRQLNKITEDEPESEYFELIKQTFEALDNAAIPLELVRFWFAAQLLRIEGLTPNLFVDDQGNNLQASRTYNFNFERKAFSPAEKGVFGADHIKLLRLGFEGRPVAFISRIENVDNLAEAVFPVVSGVQTNI